MAIFGNNKTVQQKTEEALGLFTRAIDQLKDANAEAEVIKRNNQEEMDRLRAENDNLSNMTDANSKVIDNMEALIFPK